MTSGTLLFNLAREDARRRKWLFFLWVYFCLMQLGTCLLMGRSEVELSSFLAGPPNRLFMTGSAVMGLALGITGMGFLFSGKKTDFYLALPAGRGCLFGAVSVSSLLIYLIPMAAARIGCYMIVFGRPYLRVNEPVSGIGKGIVSGCLIFLLFYLLAVLAAVLFGNPGAAVPGLAVFLFYGKVLVGYILPGMGELYMKSFYRSELLERWAVYLSPPDLIRAYCDWDRDSGGRYLEQWTYEKHLPELIGILLFTAVLAVLTFWLFRKRPAEKSEQALAFPKIRMPFSVLVSVPCGLLAGLLLVRISGDGSAAAMSVGILAGTVTVYGLLGILFSASLKGFFSGKWAMPVSAAMGFAILVCFRLFGNVYDTDFPDRADVASAAVSIRGIDMARGTAGEGYEDIRRARLADMELVGEDLDHVYQWLGGLTGSGDAEQSFAEVTVLFRMKDGQNRYRTYGIESSARLFGFETVYHSSAYKKGVGQLPYLSSLEGRNVVWYNGIDSFCLDLTQEEKETLLACIDADNQSVRMEELSVRVPLGAVSWSFGTEPGGVFSYIYEDFGETLGFLEERGIGAYLKVRPERILQAEKTVTDGRGGILLQESQPEGSQQGESLAGNLISREMDRNPLLMRVEENATYLLKIRGLTGQTFLEGEFYRVVSS